MTVQTISRRTFFTGSVEVVEPAVLRPPGLDFDKLSDCTACGKCMSACPESVIKPDAIGRPVIDFSKTGCTFCSECASACPEGLFVEADAVPWSSVVSVAESCLLQSGVACQLCTDFCDANALRYDLSVRPVGALMINQDDCTGCGMCVGSCPTGAIDISPEPIGEMSK